MAKRKVPLTDAEYVKRGGGICPFCRSSNIEGEGVEVESASATQECTCNECGACWSDQYGLAGFTVHSEPDAED